VGPSGSEIIVAKPVSSKAAEFIEGVMRTRPKLAAFDCDGTLWEGDAGERFFDWEIKHGVISDDLARRARARYSEYKAGKVSEDDMCGEMVTLHSGMLEAHLHRLAAEFFQANFVQRIFPEMLELVSRLQKSGCEVWAVSSTNEWVIRNAAKYFGISEDNILAASVQIDEGTITDRLVRVPSGPGKPQAIREVIKRVPDAVFGNSRWDVDMLEMARHPFAINPNPDLEKIAQTRGWTIHFPEAVSVVK
jgi:HAD superfamily phosphoserine phosphatase-like hydrolase